MEVCTHKKGSPLVSSGAPCCGGELSFLSVHKTIGQRGNLSRDGSRIFFRRGCTRLLLYFNTNKPHSFCRIPVVLENCRSSQGGGGGGGVRTPRTLPLDPPLLRASGDLMNSPAKRLGNLPYDES